MEEVRLSPVAGWQVDTAPNAGALVIMLRYLVSPMESIEQAHESPRFVLHTAQARELADLIVRAADKVDSASPQTGALPKH